MWGDCHPQLSASPPDLMMTLFFCFSPVSAGMASIQFQSGFHEAQKLPEPGSRRIVIYPPGHSRGDSRELASAVRAKTISGGDCAMAT